MVGTAEAARYEPGEIIHEGPRHRVQRARRRNDGAAVVLKRLAPDAGAAALARLEHEHRLLRELALPGVIRVVELAAAPEPLLVLEEMGGRSLDRLPVPMPLQPFLELACGLAETLAALHRKGVVHRNVTPENILFNGENGAFRLIDFAAADQLPQRAAAPQPPAALECSLPFISPEQTGRINRAVDYRTDFYSLGATFYWLLTGSLPFTAQDDLGLLHCHIAAAPVPPHLRDPRVPEALSRIVLKLMAKMAEDRYQSGLGLKADLERCLRGLRETGSVPLFEPGAEDYSDRLQMPQRLCGREREIARLLAAFARAAAGGSELLLVAGYSGVGKTALVRELQGPVLERHGYFIEGKFDQLQRNVPYCALVQAFEAFANQLLMESEDRLAEWRRRILAAVRSSGRVLTDTVPELERVLGPQPAVAEVGAGDAQNRFVFMFIDFIKAIASPEHPLVLFLDDLQWIDGASLNLLHQLARDGGVRGLLVVGAYRDNEVDQLHPLTAAINALRAERAALELIPLAPLTEESANELIAECLRCPPAASAPLTRVVYAKTAGNAFFTLQTLKSLTDSGAVAFDVATRRWRWETAALEQLEISDNVVALMVARLRTLDPAGQRALSLAACLGFRFAPAQLAAVAGCGEAELDDLLQPVLREGLVVPAGNHLQFVHDRVRQAAYALVPEAEQERMHLEVGRLLLARLDTDARDEQIFAVADNLNAGIALIGEAAERLALAGLNLRAGRKAKASAAFSVAVHYFREGFRLLPADGWRSHYPLTLALHMESARCEYLASNHQVADALIAAALAHAQSDFDKADIYAIQVVIHTTQNRFADSIAAGLTALRLFGQELPDPADDAALRAALERAMQLYRERLSGADFASLAAAPAMSDPQARACMELLVHMVLAAYYLNRNLYALLTVTMTNLALRHGNSSAAALGYVLMAAISVTELKEFRNARDLGRLALEVNGHHADPALEGKILMFYANTVAPWFQSLASAAPLLRRSFVAAMDAGALNDAANSLWGLLRNSLDAGAPLDQVLHECDKALAFAERIHDQGYRLAMLFMRNVAWCFQGRLPGAPALSTGDFDEAAFLDFMERSGFLSTIAHYNIFKTWVLFTLGDFDRALERAVAGARTLTYVADQPHAALHYFHHSLLLLRRPPDAAALAQVAENQGRLALFSDYCPDNYAHLHLLVEAERARATGSDPADLYDRAIEAASRSRHLYGEAIACELAGRHWLAHARDETAALYLERAHRACGAWQGVIKTRALEAEFPQWLAGARPAAASGGDGELDLKSVMKASQAISGEMELHRLVGALMRIVIENAGAQRGLLLLEQEGAWRIVARGELGDAQVPEPPLEMEHCDQLSTGVVRYVARTRERVVLDDAARVGRFAADPDLRRRGTKSLLCAPLLARGRLMGIFYLENDLTTAAFTPARVQLLEMLLAQAAISLENARIYESLRESETRYRRIVDTATEGILLLDAAGVITFANARMAELLGYTPAELTGRPYASLMFEADLADNARRMEARRRGLAETYERRFRRKDGRTLWTIASASPIFEAGGFSGSFGMFSDITERRRAEHELLRSNRFLRTLSRCNETLVHASDEQALLRDMCSVVVGTGGFELAWVGYLQPGRTLKVMARVDAHGSDYLRDDQPIGAGPWDPCRPAMRAALTGAPQVVQEVAGDPCEGWRTHAARYGFGSAIALPVRVGGEVMGVLSISAAERASFGPDEVALLSELAGDLGYGIESLRVRRDREQFMERLRASMESTIRALSSTVELRDPYTAGHQRRVAELSAAVARRLGWPEERVQAIYLVGLVHDIGKIAVPAEILSKPGRLAQAELDLVRTHAQAGYEILKGVEFSWPIDEIVRQHHERMDGSGYPRGLRGEAICPEARVLAVCDVLEAMTTHRPYRAGLGLEAALEELQRGKGSLYDAAVVDACVRVIRDGFRPE